MIGANETPDVQSCVQQLCGRLSQKLSADFPQFQWKIRIIKRRDFPRSIPADPLELLEFGSDIKIEYGFDFVLCFTSMSLLSRFNQATSGVPSNMLETGVITLSRILEIDEPHRIEQALLSLCLHVLGHLWGLGHSEGSVMQPREFWHGDEPVNWTEEERSEISDFITEIADPRLEETAQAPKNVLKFYLQVLAREGLQIAGDILFSRSWLMMLHLGRFTAATAVSITFLFLSAEAWEMGAAIKSGWLDAVLAGVLLAATLSLYFGQNLQAVGRADRMMEQAVRSRIVLFGTLLVGMVSFWINLFIISTGIIYIMPEKVFAGWAGLESIPVFHFAKLMATFGIVASALGGNMEEEHDMKAVLVYTEET